MRVCPHRAGTVQRDRGRDVFEGVRFHLAQQRAQSVTVKLEHAERISPAEQLVGFCIIELQLLEVKVFAAVGVNVLDGVRDDGEITQPEEVHLD